MTTCQTCRHTTHQQTHRAVALQSISAEFSSINDQINELYKTASEVESQARQLEARIAQIKNARHHLPERRYGQLVDLKKIRSNLTLTSLIAQDSAELAHYCGIDTGIKHRIDEQNEARAMAAQSLLMRTDALRAKNQAAAQHREQNLVQGRNPLTGGLF